MRLSLRVRRSLVARVTHVLLACIALVSTAAHAGTFASLGSAVGSYMTQVTSPTYFTNMFQPLALQVGAGSAMMAAGLAIATGLFVIDVLKTAFITKPADPDAVKSFKEPIWGFVLASSALTGFAAIGAGLFDLVAWLVGLLAPSASAGGFGELITSLGAGIDNLLASASWGGPASTVLTNIMLLAVLFFALIIAALCAAQFLVAIVVGFVLLAVGVALGPIFIGTVGSKVAKPHFDSWMGFCYAAILTIAIGHFLATLLGQLVTNIVARAVSAVSSGGLLSAQDALFLFVSLYAIRELFSNLPSIASALASGQLGVQKTGGIVASMAKPI